MTEYTNYRITEADYCKCSHVRGSHAGKHFGLRMAIMAIGCGLMLPFSYLSKIGIFPDWEGAVFWAVSLGIILFLNFKVIDQGCSFCTCNKFKWSGRNKYE